MAAVMHLDTHVLVWLYERNETRLQPVLRRLSGRSLVASPMAVLELQYLYEVGRANTPAESVVTELTGSVDLRIATAPFFDVARCAMGQHWTRDPFDRLIVATALAENATLLTKDGDILANVPSACWA